MEIKSRPKERTEYFLICRNCRKEIRGTSESQVVYNFKVHYDNIHMRKEEQENPDQVPHAAKKGASNDSPSPSS